MIAVCGIAHSEQSVEQECSMHGVQLWIALRNRSRHCAPTIEHFSQLSSATQDSTTTTVFIGTYGELVSKAKIYSDLVGAEFSSEAGTFELVLNPFFKYGILNVGCWEKFLSQKRFFCGGSSSLAHIMKLSKRANVGTLMILLSLIFLTTLM